MLVAFVAAPAAAVNRPRVVIDAGHGGPDPGAVNCDFEYAGESCLHEADINLRIVRKIKRMLASTGIDLDLTRRRDQRVNRPFESIRTWNLGTNGKYRFYDDGALDSKDELQARVNIANCARPKRSCAPSSAKEADAFVSIHSNSCGGCGARGATTFYHGSESARLARLIQRAVTALTDQKDRGTQVAPFYVLRWTRMPAALLESGFMDNNREARRLMRSAFQKKIARGVSRAVLKFVCSGLGNAGRDNLTGTSKRDVLCGLGGHDEVTARGGDDVILGGPGDDLLRGNGGDDYISGGPGADVCLQGSGTGRQTGCEARSVQ